MRGVKGWSVSAGEERSGAGESSNSSSRTRSFRSHARLPSSAGRRRPDLRRAMLERRAGARWRVHTGRARPPWSSRERGRGQSQASGGVEHREP
eukprot:6212451-Pleurochrysis_carterae.AAC.8